VTRLRRHFGRPWKSSGCYFASVGRLLLLGIIFGFPSCAPNSPIPEADYRVKLVGDWLGTVGDTKETMSFKADSSFVAQVRPAGFISNTLSQGTTGTIRGTWTITGNVITMKIMSADNENMQNKETSSAIVTFSQNELVVRSVSGETSTFMRAI
jgi:hypothetical protein